MYVYIFVCTCVVHVHIQYMYTCLFKHMCDILYILYMSLLLFLCDIKESVEALCLSTHVPRYVTLFTIDFCCSVHHGIAKS